MRASILLACALALAGCGSAAEDESDQDSEELGGETYGEYDERRDELEGSQGSYAGDGCTEDCGGHKAGYAWAEENGITDPGDCGGNSWSFVEGCRAYAEEHEGE